MKKNLKITIAVFLCFINTYCFSQTFQNVSFYDVKTQTAPQNPILKELKTFDVRLAKSEKFYIDDSSQPISSLDKTSFTEFSSEKNKNEFSVFLTSLNFSPLKHVETGGDLHIVVLLQKYKPTPSGSFVYFHITLYDKYMNTIGDYQSNWEKRLASTQKKIKSGEGFKGNVRIDTETALEDILQYVYKISTESSTKSLEVSLAQFEKVKKFPDLQDFNTIVEETQKTLKKEGANAWVKEITKEDLEYWGGFVDEKEDTENNDIKRAALHNLSVYHILKNDEKKAFDYLKKYENIDIEIKDGALGEKYKASGIVSRLYNRVFTKKENQTQSKSEIATNEILERHQYITVKGEVEKGENSKLLKENFKGKIQIVKPEPYFQDQNSTQESTIGGTYQGVAIRLIDDSGNIREVKSLDIGGIKTESNDLKYVVRKYKLMTFTYYLILEKTFGGNKISLFQELFPDQSPKNKSTVEKKDLTPGTYFWMALKDETEGVQTTVLGMKKRVFEYLSNCPKLKDKYQEQDFEPSVVLDLVKDFEKCK